MYQRSAAIWRRKLCILQLLHSVHTIDYIEPGAIIPVHQEATGIIHTGYRSLGTDGRCLNIVHLYKLHSGSGRIAEAQAFNLRSISE